MVRYACEWCWRPRRAGEKWLVGFAAEKNGPAGCRREFLALPKWTEKAAAHPLAVHFCCEDHKQRWVAKLLEPPPVPESPKRVAPPRMPRTSPLAGAISGRLTHAQVKSIRERLAQMPQRTAAPSKPRRKRTQFTDADRVRAHGLGIQL